jgi:hypothetical protein
MVNDKLIKTPIILNEDLGNFTTYKTTGMIHATMLTIRITMLENTSTLLSPFNPHVRFTLHLSIHSFNRSIQKL